MSAMIQLIAGKQMKGKVGSLLTKVAEKFAGASERFWFCLSFLLFVVMGPFAVFAVIIGLFTLAKDKSNKDAAEPSLIGK